MHALSPKISSQRSSAVTCLWWICWVLLSVVASMKSRKSLKSSRTIIVHQVQSLKIKLSCLYLQWWHGSTHQRNPPQVQRKLNRSRVPGHQPALKKPRTKKNSSQTRIFRLDLHHLSINKLKLLKPWQWQHSAFLSTCVSSSYAQASPMETESQTIYSMSFTEAHGWVSIQILPLCLLLALERTESQQFTLTILFNALSTCIWTFLINLSKWSLSSTL